MLNIEIVDIKKFKINRKLYPRNCYIHINDDGSFTLVDCSDNRVILENTALADIKIDNQPLADIEALRNAVFNRVCQCGSVYQSVFSSEFNQFFS